MVRSDNPITEYLRCNVLFICEDKEFLVFIVLYKNFQNTYCDNTVKVLVSAMGLGNLPSVWIWTAKMIWFSL